MAEKDGTVGVDAGQGRRRQKKYHRRSPWACDECRLRKRKCDGTQPCKACKLNDRDCAYDYKSRPLPAPNQRLRVLEERIRNVRTLVQDLEVRSRPHQISGLDNIIEALDCPLPDMVGNIIQARENEVETEKSTKADDDEDESEKSSDKLSSMMGGSGHFAIQGPMESTFYGPLSGFCFVWRMLQLFTADPVKAASLPNIRNMIVDVFNGRLTTIEMLGMNPAGFQILPPKDLTFELLEAFFTRCHPLIYFLNENDFKRTVEQIYNEPRLQLVGWEHRFMPLLHAVLALGYLFHIPRHRSYGCSATVKEATRHFLTARNSFDLTHCNDMVSLQVLLCLIQYLISTSCMSSAHAYIGLACSAMHRLGLHAHADSGPLLSDEQQQIKSKLVVTILRFDAYASLILGLPAFVNLQALDHELSEPSPRGFSISSRVSVFSTDDDLQQAASVRHLELMRLVSTGFKDVFLPPTDVHYYAEEQDYSSVDADSLAEVEVEFQKWAKNAAPLLAQLEGNESLALSKYELEIAYYFGQIVICQPFLHYVMKMAAGSPISKRQSQYALACIKIASTTITRSELMSQKDALYPASWLSIYTIFLAVGSLMFLVAAHKGTSMPGQAWRKAESGIRILTAMSCVDDGATKCLRTLKMITQQLSHTVDFDWDHIEATTARMCHNHSSNESRQRVRSTASSPLTLGTPSTPVDFQRHPISRAPVLPRPWSEILPSSYEISNNLVEQGFKPLNADQIFAQAQQSSLTGGFDMFGSLDQYGY